MHFYIELDEYGNSLGCVATTKAGYADAVAGMSLVDSRVDMPTGYAADVFVDSDGNRRFFALDIW